MSLHRFRQREIVAHGQRLEQILHDLFGDRADLSVILWSVDPCDWDEAAWDGVLPTVLSEAHDGRIILMHDLSAHSVTCALQAIDRLMAQGYEFCTVSQLAQLRGTALAPGEVYTGFPPKDS